MVFWRVTSYHLRLSSKEISGSVCKFSSSSGHMSRFCFCSHSAKEERIRPKFDACSESLKCSKTDDANFPTNYQPHWYFFCFVGGQVPLDPNFRPFLLVDWPPVISAPSTEFIQIFELEKPHENSSSSRCLLPKSYFLHQNVSVSFSHSVKWNFGTRWLGSGEN